MKKHTTTTKHKPHHQVAEPEPEPAPDPEPIPPPTEMVIDHPIEGVTLVRRADLR